MEKYQLQISDWLDYVQEFTVLFFENNCEIKNKLGITTFECYTEARNLASEFKPIGCFSHEEDFTDRCRNFMKHKYGLV